MPSRSWSRRRTCGSHSRIPTRSGISGRGFELDLANLIIPTRVTELRPSSLHRLSAQLGGNNLTEQLGYVGPVLPAVAGFVLWERRRQPLAARAGGDDRLRDRLRARLATRRGRSPHQAGAAVDVRRRPSAGRPRAARARIRDRVACARRAGRAVPLARRSCALGGLRAAGAHAAAEPGRQPLGDETRPARALRRGSLALAHPPRRERADHPVQLRRAGHAVAGGVGLRLSHDGRLRVGDAARRAGGATRSCARSTACRCRRSRTARCGPWCAVATSTSCSCAAAGPDRGRASSARLSERRGHPAACSPGGCAVPGRPR